MQGATIGWRQGDPAGAISPGGRFGRAAFTLVELLAVILVVAVLAALLLPALSAAKATALRTKCASNLKNVGVAIQLYTGEHDGTLPGPSYYPLYAVRPLTGTFQFLPQYVAPYLGYAATNAGSVVIREFICPSVPSSAITSAAPPVSYCVEYVKIPGQSQAIVPFGYIGGGGLNPAPMTLAKLAGMVSISQLVALQEVDKQGPGMGVDVNYPGGNYALPASGAYVLSKPGHVKRNALYFDWHIEAK